MVLLHTGHRGIPDSLLGIQPVLRLVHISRRRGRLRVDEGDGRIGLHIACGEALTIILDAEVAATILVVQAVAVAEPASSVLRNTAQQFRQCQRTACGIGICEGRMVQLVADVEETAVPEEPLIGAVACAKIVSCQTHLSVTGAERTVLPPKILHLRTFVRIQPVVQFPVVQTSVQTGKLYHILLRRAGERTELNAHQYTPQSPEVL